MCEPSETPVPFQLVEYGEAVTGEPRFVLSTLNCTLATATLSEAVAEIVTDEPETVAPLDGAVSETVGGVVSGAAPPPKMICPGA